jgi:serine/threonine protein kinase
MSTTVCPAKFVALTVILEWQTLGSNWNRVHVSFLRSPYNDAMTNPTDPQNEPALETQELLEYGTTYDHKSGFSLGKIGPYQLLCELGRGGMGAVYQARHTNLQRIVAIKVLPRELADSPERLERFRREMAAIGRLEHPNIVLATDAGDADGVAYIAMQYVEGADVSAVAKRMGALNTDDACEIVRQAALGLQHVFECGLVHRDIKPSNLFVTKNGDSKLLDLGLAMLRERDGQSTAMTAVNAMMGTPDFIAPEQINDSHRVDIRADIYSLGCTLYTLLAGRAPFSGPQYSTTTSKLVAHAERQPESLKSLCPQLPSELVQVVEKMMAKSPPDRYSEPKEIAEVLIAWSATANLAALADAKSQDALSPNRTRLQSKDSRQRFSPFMKGVASVAGSAVLLAILCISLWNRTPKISTNDSTRNSGPTTDSDLPPSLAHSESTTEKPLVNPSATNDLSAIASSIDRSTQQISQSTQSIETSNRKIEENTGRIAQSFDELFKRLDGPLGAKPLESPQTPGEHYYNAIVYGMQGNQKLARQSFLAYFDADQDFIDPHLKFISLLKLQEGIAAAREIYKSLPGDRSLLSRQFAEVHLLDSGAKTETLKSLVSKHDMFAPAWYALGVEYSANSGARQTFLETTQERDYLKEFLNKHEQGGLLKYYLDQSEAAALVRHAEARLKALMQIDQSRIENPVSLTLVVKVVDHWQAMIEIAEPAKEIFFRVGETGEFQSTGKLIGVDPATGYQVPKKMFDIPGTVTQSLLGFRYIDLKDQMRGPFTVRFDASEQTAKWERSSIEQSKSLWLRLVDDRLYFDVFNLGRTVLSEVRYAVDAENPEKTKAIPKDVFGAENSRDYSEVISKNSKFAVIQLKYTDGTESEIVRIERK